MCVCVCVFVCLSVSFSLYIYIIQNTMNIFRLNYCCGSLTHLTGLTPLQVSGSTSAGRVICGTDLAECVSVPGDFLRPQGAFPPGFYLLREGWVNHPAPEAPLIRGMPTGPLAFLGNAGRVSATALRPDPP